MIKWYVIDSFDSELNSVFFNLVIYQRNEDFILFLGQNFASLFSDYLGIVGDHFSLYSHFIYLISFWSIHFTEKKILLQH